jgi:23S rRNA pseudouridine2605 synthase
MRINRYLAQAGLGSRRACEALVESGEVTINGQTVTNLATQVGPKDQIKVGRKLIRAEQSMTVVLHKPPGYLCTTDDPEKRRTIYDLIPKDWPRLFYVGRLDNESEGLLLLTNDGALSQRLTHPKYKLPKTYEVVLDQEFNFEEAPKLLKGMVIEGEWAKFVEIHRLGPKCVKVILTQGIKRQIRLMFWRLGYTVQRLVRTQIGSLKLGRLRPGEWKILDEDEVKSYFSPDRPRRAPVRAAQSARSGLLRRDNSAADSA